MPDQCYLLQLELGVNIRPPIPSKNTRPSNETMYTYTALNIAKRKKNVDANKQIPMNIFITSVVKRKAVYNAKDCGDINCPKTRSTAIKAPELNGLSTVTLVLASLISAISVLISA